MSWVGLPRPRHLAGELVCGQRRPHGRMALAHEVGIGSRNALRRALADLG
jgi:hypothetical protein